MSKYVHSQTFYFQLSAILYHFHRSHCILNTKSLVIKAAFFFFLFTNCQFSLPYVIVTLCIHMCQCLHFYSLMYPLVNFFYYRRLLQMGVYNAELFNNLGLCCFYAQQYDMTLSSFERAISLSTDDLTTSDIWYNIGQVAQVRSLLWSTETYCVKPFSKEFFMFQKYICPMHLHLYRLMILQGISAA